MAKLSRDAVVVAGVRTPFLRSNGAYRSLMSHDLGRYAVAGLLERTGLDPGVVDQVVMGTVISDPRTSNVAREIALGAGLPPSVPAYTTSLACVSANVAVTTCVESIWSGHLQVAIAGGAESFSDPPIRLSKRLRQALVKLQKARGPADYVAILKNLSPRDLVPDIPTATEFSTGLTMGESCERMAKAFGVTREESDRFAERSHQLASLAWAEGRLTEEVLRLELPPNFDAVERDDGPRPDTTLEGLARLKPAFDRDFGILTAGSSSFLTDGASALVLMSRERAAELGREPMAVVRDYVYTAADPLDELLLGPALAIPKLLRKVGLQVEDVDVWEIHEAFAAQMVANLKALNDDRFARERLGETSAVGAPPLERVNVWGGSLSLGHPFGATGARLVTTAARRLSMLGGRYAVVAGCAAGGQGSAILLETTRSDGGAG